jgi:hypothetical protein
MKRVAIAMLLVAVVCASGIGCSRHGGGGGAGIPGGHDDGGASSAQPASSP